MKNAIQKVVKKKTDLNLGLPSVEDDENENLES